MEARNDGNKEKPSTISRIPTTIQFYSSLFFQVLKTNHSLPITSKNKSSFPRTFKSIHQVFIFLSHTFFNRFLTHEERFNQAQPRSPTLDLNGLASKVRSVLIPNDTIVRLFCLLLSTTRTQLTHVFSHFDYTHTHNKIGGTFPPSFSLHPTTTTNSITIIPTVNNLLSQSQI